MNTNELISLLATGVEPVDRQAVPHRYMSALAFGLPVTLLLMLALMGVRPDISTAVWMPMFWIKLLFTGGLMWGCLLMTLRLSRPESNLGGTPLVIAAFVVAIWLFAGFELVTAPVGAGRDLLFGSTWQRCPLLIVALSAPMAVISTLAMRDLAPTRLPQAGMALGLLSGSAGAMIYSLHCPEMEAPFLATWYLLGILVPGIAGFLFGQRLLRW